MDLVSSRIDLGYVVGSEPYVVIYSVLSLSLCDLLVFDPKGSCVVNLTSFLSVQVYQEVKITQEPYLELVTVIVIVVRDSLCNLLYLSVAWLEFD